MNLTGVRLIQSLTDNLVVIYLQHPALICILECPLEVLSDLLLSELFLDTIDDCHNSLDIPIKDVTLL